MLKNGCSIILCWKIVKDSGPGFPFLLFSSLAMISFYFKSRHWGLNEGWFQWNLLFEAATIYPNIFYMDNDDDDKKNVFWIVTNILMSYYIFRPLYSGKRRRLLPFLRDFHFLVRWRTSNAPIILTKWSTSFIEIAFSVQNNANVHLLVKFAYLKVSTQRGNAF